MAMQRPAWTICLVIVWITILPGIILTHSAVGNLLPALQDLPANLIKGFENVLKFQYLESDAEKIKTSAESALMKCGAGPVQGCEGYPLDPTLVNVAEQKSTITGAFSSSLNVVSKVANDKYFGIPDFQETADNLNSILEEMNKMEDEMQCGASNAMFCHMYYSATGITDGMATVRDALDEFKSNPAVAEFKDYSSYLVALHGLPYILIVGMLCLMIFWYNSHKGCCPHGLCYLPFFIFWLVNFVFYDAVLVGGLVVTQAASSTPLQGLQGEPTLDEFLTHIQTDYSEFWDVVFEGLIAGLGQLLTASYFFVGVSVVIFVYSMCLCCCRPYKDEGGSQASAGASSGSYSGPGTESQGRQFIEALHGEYVNGKGAMVGVFVDNLGDAGKDFFSHEEKIRDAGNKEQAINELTAKWGLPTEADV